jgi:putative Holliday junction resolvase
MILSLDYGERYIGIAITDYDERLAVRHSVIDQKKEDALKKIAEIVMREEITTVLVGIPTSLSGNETAQTHVSLDFIEKLQQALGEDIKVHGADETLTSVEAERHIKLEGGKPEDGHMEAARIILEDFLRQRKPS